MSVLKIDHFSTILNAEVGLNVVGYFEQSFTKDTKVLLLLHGLGGNQNDFLYKANIVTLSKKYNFIAIIPNAGRSFYTNMVHGYDYYDYINKEIFNYINQVLAFDFNQAKRYVLGVSMGGYGALKLALSNPKMFHGCASISGTVDLVSRDPIKRSCEKFISAEWNNIFGAKLLPEHDLFSKIDRSITVRLYLACGTKDHLFDYNNKFSQLLTSNHVEHLYDVNEGEHDWDFFARQIEPAITYLFREFCE